MQPRALEPGRDDPTYEGIVRRMGKPVVAVVFFAETYNALAIIRALGRKGIPVYALGSEADSIGFYSRYTSQRLVQPDPVKDPQGFLKVLNELGRQLQRDGKTAVLVPTGDRIVDILSKHRAALPDSLNAHLPPPEVVEQCLDKLAQYRLAKEIGVPFPKTYLETEAAQIRRDLDQGGVVFPLLAKARQPLRQYELNRKYRRTVLNDRQQLDTFFAEAARDGIRFLVQEIIPGGDEQLYTLGSAMNRSGEFLAIFTGRKLRQKPPGFGICRVGECKYVEEIIRAGGKLLKALGFFGTSQVEFKYDHRDGQYKLMEVNPRSWSWIGLPVAMGINLPFATFCDSLGIELPFQPMIKDKRVLWISLADDLEMSRIHRDGFPWRHCFEGYDQIVEAYYARDDRRPGLVNFQRMLAGYARRALKTIGL